MIDDTPLMKKGEHSVGVTLSQYCSQLWFGARMLLLPRGWDSIGSLPLPDHPV